MIKERKAETPQATSFELVFAQARQNAAVVQEVERVSREIENIRLLSEAIAEINAPHVTTFMTQ